MALMDLIKQGMAQKAPTAGATTDTAPNPLQQLQAASRAKTGKQVQPSGPQASNLMQQVQQSQAQKAMEDVGRQGQMASTNIEQSFNQQAQQAAQKGEILTREAVEAQNNFREKSEELYRQFGQQGKQLNLKKDKSQLEQLGFTLRLSNDKYIHNLRDMGARKRLDSRVGFQEELQKAVFEDEMELFNNSMDFRRIMNADDRELKDQLSQMDLDFALEMAEAQNKAASQGMIWSGVGSIVSGAAAYAATPSAPAGASDAASTINENSQALDYGHSPAFHDTSASTGSRA